MKFNFGESQGDWGWGVGKGKRLDTLRNLPKASLRGWSAIVGQALSLCHPQRLRWSFPLPQSKLRRLRWFPPLCTEASEMVLPPSPKRTVEDACPCGYGGGQKSGRSKPLPYQGGPTSSPPGRTAPNPYHSDVQDSAKRMVPTPWHRWGTSNTAGMHLG